MSKLLSQTDWEVLITRIKDGRCTPFLGAGACYGILPLARDIALEWAERHGYPMEDIDDLGNVAQYVAITTSDPTFPKELIAKLLEKVYPEDFGAIEKSHGLIAKLPSPVFITTNYDDFLYRSLQAVGKKPKRVICAWNTLIEKETEYLLEEDFSPSEETPIVFHLHGINEVPESIVLTEDDYVDFLINLGRYKYQKNIIPHQIQKAITSSSLLFMGYGMRDWSFRVIFRGLISQMEDSLRRTSLAVQLKKEDKRQEEYLNKYFGEMKIKVFWGNAAEFIEELNKRLDSYE